MGHFQKPTRRNLRGHTLIFLLVLSLPQYAHTAESIYQQADKLLGSRQTEQAYDLLWQAIMSNPDDIMANYLFGKAAMQLKLYENAASAYERILALDPDQEKARLNLGIAMYALGSHRTAELVLNQLLLAKPNSKTRKEAERYLGRINKKGGGASRWQTILSAGRIYSDNTGATQFGDTDWGTILSLGVRNKTDINGKSGLSWRSRALFHTTMYDDQTDDDLAILSLETGPAYVYKRDFVAAATLSLNHVYLGSDSYYRLYGIKPQITLIHAPNLSTRIRTQWQYQDYTDENESDGNYYSIGIIPRLFWDNRRYMLQWEFGYEWKEAEDDNYAFSGPHTKLTFRASPSEWLESRLAVGYSKSGYDEPFSYLPTEDNELYIVSLKLLLPSPWKETNTVISFDYKKNDSNIDAYTYTEKRAMISLRKEF